MGGGRPEWYYSKQVAKKESLRDKIYSLLGLGRAYSKGTVLHGAMCAAATDYSSAKAYDTYGTKTRTIFTEGFSHSSFLTIQDIRASQEKQRLGVAARPPAPPPVPFLSARPVPPPRPLRRRRKMWWTRRAS